MTEQDRGDAPIVSEEELFAKVKERWPEIWADKTLDEFRDYLDFLEAQGRIKPEPIN